MPGGSTGFRIIFSALTSLGAERPFTRPPILRTSEPEGSLSPSWMDTCIRGVSHQFQQHFADVFCAAFGGILKGSGAICERNPGLFPKGIRGNPGESGGIRHLFGIWNIMKPLRKQYFGKICRGNPPLGLRAYIILKKESAWVASSGRVEPPWF